MKDRIKRIRKDAGVNQTDFAESLGLSRTFIGQIEIGTNTMSDRTIRDICRIYHVNEEWLRTGEGDPYTPRPRNQQIADFMNQAMEGEEDELKSQLVYGLSQLDPADWEDLARILKKIAKKD